MKSYSKNLRFEVLAAVDGRMPRKEAKSLLAAECAEAQRSHWRERV